MSKIIEEKQMGNYAIKLYEMYPIFSGSVTYEIFVEDHKNGHVGVIKHFKNKARAQEYFKSLDSVSKIEREMQG